MLTLKSIKETAETDAIDLDIDDERNFYIKQGDDWIVLTGFQLAALSDALIEQLER